MAQNSYRDDLSRVSAVYYREQIETSDHKTMFRIMDSLIGNRTSMASVLPKTIDKATLPSMLTDFICPTNTRRSESTSNVHNE